MFEEKIKPISYGVYEESLLFSFGKCIKKSHEARREGGARINPLPDTHAFSQILLFFRCFFLFPKWFQNNFNFWHFDPKKFIWLCIFFHLFICFFINLVSLFKYVFIFWTRSFSFYLQNYINDKLTQNLIDYFEETQK